MSIQTRVLLVGKNMKNSFALGRRLQERACEYKVVLSSDDAREMLIGERFDLILGELDLNTGALPEQIDFAIRFSATLYYCLPVEDSCWWLPAVLKGQPCLGSPALRPAEFSRVLDETLDEIARQKRNSSPCDHRPSEFVSSGPPGHELFEELLKNASARTVAAPAR